MDSPTRCAWGCANQEVILLAARSFLLDCCVGSPQFLLCGPQQSMVLALPSLLTVLSVSCSLLGLVGALLGLRGSLLSIRGPS